MAKSITDKIRQQVMALYMEGCNASDIMRITGIKSSSTLYKVINDLGIRNKRAKNDDLLHVAITLPRDLERWCESQPNLSQAIEQLIREKIAYSEIEGTFQKEPFLPYSEIEGQEKNAPSMEEACDGDDGEEAHNLDLHYYAGDALVDKKIILSFINRPMVTMLAKSMYSQTEGHPECDRVLVYQGEKLLWCIKMK